MQPPIANETGGELCLLTPDEVDEIELTATERSTALLAWYLILAGLVLIIALALLTPQAYGQTNLTITAHITGTGLMNSNYTGDWLNVSLLQNGTGIDISVVGGAA